MALLKVGIIYNLCLSVMNSVMYYDLFCDEEGMGDETTYDGKDYPVIKNKKKILPQTQLLSEAKKCRFFWP